MGEFPEGYPPDLMDRILQEGGGFAELYAYRVAPYGYDNPDSYLSTILNDKKRRVTKNRDLQALTTYSTSCCATKEAAIELKGAYFRKVPEAEIAEGDIKPEQGPCKTSDETPHIDWWLFKDAAPWLYFKRTEV